MSLCQALWIKTTGPVTWCIDLYPAMCGTDRLLPFAILSICEIFFSNVSLSLTLQGLF